MPQQQLATHINHNLYCDGDGGVNVSFSYEAIMLLINLITKNLILIYESIRDLQGPLYFQTSDYNMNIQNPLLSNFIHLFLLTNDY